MDDPTAFRTAAEAFLCADEMRHNLFLGLLATLEKQPEVYPDHGLWIVEDAGTVVGAALMTPPHNLLLATPARAGALESLIQAVLQEGLVLPGVVGTRPEVDAFVDLYTAATGGRVASRMEQALHVLNTVSDVPVPAGRARPALAEDFELVVEWNRAFSTEVAPENTWDEAETRRRLSHRVPDGSGGGMRIWEDGGPVCIVGFVDATERIARIGPVYTPPHLRRRGYAAALTAYVTREMLASGKTGCLLYTDLANPTSNAIYHRIGYRRLCDGAMIAFEPAVQAEQPGVGQGGRQDEARVAGSEERNLGEQPLAGLLVRHGLMPRDLVTASTEQITHKMVNRAVRGRRLTPHVGKKICNALNRASEGHYAVGDLFTYI